MAKDIEKHGLQQPILIKPIIHDQYLYKIISGHRRYISFRVLKREVIPCIINDVITDSDALILNLGENLHRENLNILQEANALRRLKMSGFSAKEVSDELFKSITWVTVRYKLLELPEEIQKAAAAGFIKQLHIGELHKMNNRKLQLVAVKKLKMAKARGDKVPTITRPKKDIFKRKPRESNEIFLMMDQIVDALKKNNFGTRCLAWAAGEISDLDIYRDIKEIAVKNNINYNIPYVTQEGEDA